MAEFDSRMLKHASALLFALWVAEEEPGLIESGSAEASDLIEAGLEMMAEDGFDAGTIEDYRSRLNEVVRLMR